MDVSAVFVWYAFGLHCASHFRSPYLSTSPADFWSRRWNLPVTHAMRALIYDPFAERKLVKQAPLTAESSSSSPTAVQLRRLTGAFLVFVSSGVYHEGLYWVLTGHFTRSLLWFRYFTYWGVIVVAESVLKRSSIRPPFVLPPWMSWLVTMIVCKFRVFVLVKLQGRKFEN